MSTFRLDLSLFLFKQQALTLLLSRLFRYGNTSWAVGQSYGDNPLLTAAYYDPSAPAGSRWQRPASLPEMTVERLYHSSATLMADGSIFNAGSNPNADYIPYSGYTDQRGINYKYPTEYRVEMFYPDYYDQPRPAPTGLPTTLSYGGDYFNISLTASDLGNNASAIDSVKVVVMRTGYSTHAMNMGMRMVQLNSTWTLNSDGSGVIHSAQMPPNPSIMAPGPALLYVTVNGVPSVGQDIMVGNGQIGTQPTERAQAMPGTLAQSGAKITSTSNGVTVDSNKASNGAGSAASSDKGAAGKTSATSLAASLAVGLAIFAGLML